jgi:formate-dependent phosphoribosylglycinamide formyltransferase (GAR transformylase)
MNVLMIGPGYPGEMPLFARGLARMGAEVYGVADVAQEALPALAKASLAGYLRVPSLLDEEGAIEAVREWIGPLTMDRVVCLWEPGVLLAAKLRDALGVPGMSYDEALPFRNKDVMKERVAAAGIRCPRHQAATNATEVRAAAKAIGFPVIVKPIDGAGSMDTYRADDEASLEDAIGRMGHIREMNVEEFIDGEEFTFDTICFEGRILYHNVSYYRPRPLAFRSTEWISPMTYCLRDVTDARLAGGVAMGEAVLKALDFQTGFTHMEWYLKSNGEAVFGEIAARPPGANTVDLMNFASDVDLFTGYAEAELTGRFTQAVTRPYNAVNVFKRAMGQGRIQRIEGLEELTRRYGPHIAHVDLLPIGAPRRDWVQTLVSDGYVVLRHPDLSVLMQMADAFASDLRLYAG